jgi:hypothetical protein
MGHIALRKALHKLRQPSFEKYKYAFAGYMLNCDQSFLPSESDSKRALSPLMASLMTERIRHEINLKKLISDDHLELGDQLEWNGSTRRFGSFHLPFGISVQLPDHLSEHPSRAYAIGNAITLRPEAILSHARIDQLFRQIELDPEYLYLQGKTSWDSNNEIQDYMKDYFYKFYRLPLISEQNKIRTDRALNTVTIEESLARLRDIEYNDVKELLSELQLPMMGSGGLPQLCESLADLSRRSL